MGRKNATMLCVGVATLVVLGLIMLTSVSVWFEGDESKYSHLRKQIMWAIIGVFSAVSVAYADYRYLKKWSKWIYAFSVLLLICYLK